MQRVYGQTDKLKQSNAKSEHMLHVIRWWCPLYSRPTCLVGLI
jgi:hypothetical protein